MTETDVPADVMYNPLKYGIRSVTWWRGTGTIHWVDGTKTMFPCEDYSVTVNLEGMMKDD